MSEDELNKKYIQDCLQGICQDCIYFEKTIPIILEMLKEAYKSGLVQAEIDNTMGVIEENSALTQENEKLKNIINKALPILNELINLYDDNYTVSDKAKDIKDILESEMN